jgi:hypothetical protein
LLGAVLVLVLVTWLRSSPAHTGTSDAHEIAPSARATELAAPPGPVAAVASAKELAVAEPAPASSAESASPTAAPPADDPVQCLVFGRVTDAVGAPIRVWKPWVALRDAHGVEFHTTVDELGHYALAGLAPGKWSLACEGTGLRAQQAELELSLRDPFVRRDFQLASTVRIKVQVIARDGRPYWQAVRESGAKYSMRDLLPVATSASPGASMPEADGLHNDHVGVGNFWDYGPLREGLGATYIGVLVLDGDPPVFVSLLSGVHVLETQRLEAGADEATFVLDPETLANVLGTLKLRAVDAGTRTPLQGRVRATGATGGGPEGTLDDAGAWQTTLEPGEYDVRILAQGHERLPRHVRIAAGETLDLGELALEPELTIEARVVDAEGRPLVAQEFLIGWNDPELGRLRFDDDWTHATDGNGRLAIGGLRAERYFLRSYGDDERSYPGRNEPPTEWVSGVIEVSTQNGSVQGLEIRLVQAAVLVLNGTEALAGASYRLLDEHGVRLRARRFYANSTARSKVPPGRYTLVLLGADGAELSRRTLELGHGETELDLSR